MKLLHILLIGMLLLCGSGIASAGNLTLFDDADTAAAQKTITNSGIGYVFALMNLISQYMLIVVPLVLFVMLILYKMMNNAEKHKEVLASFLLIIGALLMLQVYYSIIVGMAPDISTVQI